MAKKHTCDMNGAEYSEFETTEKFINEYAARCCSQCGQVQVRVKIGTVTSGGYGAHADTDQV